MFLAGTVLLAAHDAPWYDTLGGWSAVGGAVGGIATALLAVLAYLGGKAGLEDFRSKQRAERDLANEQAYNMRLDRQRLLHGWTPGMVNVYAVELVTDRAEMEQARDQLLARQGSEYAILRIKDGNINQGHQVRELIKTGFIARPPTLGESDALNRWLASQHPGGKWIDPIPAPAMTVSKRPWWIFLATGPRGTTTDPRDSGPPV
jgi:hypothetical protein